jgi:hypothetical protein
MIGFIQEATVDTPNIPGAQIAACANPAEGLAGGTLTLNGIRMIVPCNTILQFPAGSLAWAQVFDPKVSGPIGTTLADPPAHLTSETGLALADTSAPFPSIEVHVQGNVLAGANGEQRYVVGLIVPISQQSLNASSGFISFIDYTTGSFRVGGIQNDSNCDSAQPGGGALCSGALVQVNDPVLPNGRYGLAHSPDPRFTSDTNNPTIHAATGFPVCIPRVAPPASDTLCPLENRPLNGDPRFATDAFLPTGAPLKRFTMPPPVDGKFPTPGSRRPSRSATGSMSPARSTSSIPPCRRRGRTRTSPRTR